MSYDRFSSSAAHLSRRGLLRLSALAGTAAMSGVWAGPAHAGRPAADPPADDGGAYADAFRATVAQDRDVREHGEPGREFWYRPGQLLVAAPDLRRVLQWLSDNAIPADVGKGFAGVERLYVPDDADLPELIRELRDPEQWRGDVPAVQPHHVLIGFDNIMGNPGSPPVAAPALAPPTARRRGEGKGVLVGVCDTGIWRYASAFHPQWLAGAYVPQVDDEDALYLHGDVLALQGGHGTFVAGVLRQAAPGVSFDPEPALNGNGIGDEEMLVAAIDRLDRRTSIVNLSLGCFTLDDVPPLPIVNRLAALARGVAVVAAAGNSGGARPTWPAAMEQVVAVAAVSDDGDGPVAQKYSNFGPWVDACADGTRVSTFVTGTLDLKADLPLDFSGFARWSGTSFAAPHVAGRLAAMMSTKGITATDAVHDLLSQPRWDADYGVLVP